MVTSGKISFETRLHRIGNVSLDIRKTGRGCSEFRKFQLRGKASMSFGAVTAGNMGARGPYFGWDRHGISAQNGDKIFRGKGGR